jgi:pilus assembly protein CpaB
LDLRGKILVMLLLAALCGGASLLAARSWVAGQASEQAAAVVVAPGVTFATLVVAAEPLRFGAQLTAKNLKTIPWPGDELPAGAFRTVEDLIAGEPRTVLYPMEASEAVLAGKVTGAGERAGLSRLIGLGRRAVTIRVNEVAGVAGFILPGDRVDVVLTTEGEDTSATDVILQGVKVLTIDQIADERAEEPMVARAVTVEVDPEGAQKIALAQSIGEISLTLRPSGDITPAEVATVTPGDFSSNAGSAAVAAVAPAVPLEPVADAQPAPAPAPRPEAVTTVAVTRSLQSTEYRVPVQPAEAVVEADADDLPPISDPAAPVAEPARAVVPTPRPRRVSPPSVRTVPVAARDVVITGAVAPTPAHILDLPKLR